MHRGWVGLAVLLLSTPAAATEELLYADFEQQQQAMQEGRTSAETLTRLYLQRIKDLDRDGPRLNSVISLNPAALDDARHLDAERAAGRLRGPLHGVTVLIKDNIETADEIPTTAGSLALKDNITRRDAPLVARLRDAGAVVIGKANLSEWANYRSTRSVSGWSALGGLVRNPYALDRSACGSSSGSATATAAALVAGAVGTETDGSIICPAAMNGIVGLKPTVGLISRTHVIPIAASQDTAGPMTRSVADAATLLSVMAGADPLDPVTAEADGRKVDYRAALQAGSLKGARLGVMRLTAPRNHPMESVFETALDRLRDQGAILIEIASPDLAPIQAAEDLVLRTEFKAGLEVYLASTDPQQVRTRSLADLIAYNRSEARETPLFGQELFEQAQAADGLADPAYGAALADARRRAGPDGLDRLFAEHDLAAIVAPSGGPASVVDPVNGARWLGSPTTLPAVGGHPHLTVPMGDVLGLPLGLSFIGPAWSEARLLSLGYAFEQAVRARRNPTFAPSLNLQPAFADSYDPERSGASR